MRTEPERCSGLPASALTGGRHRSFLLAMRKSGVSNSEEARPLEPRFPSTALLQAASS